MKVTDFKGAGEGCSASEVISSGAAGVGGASHPSPAPANLFRDELAAWQSYLEHKLDCADCLGEFRMGRRDCELGAHLRRYLASRSLEVRRELEVVACLGRVHEAEQDFARRGGL